MKLPVPSVLVLSLLMPLPATSVLSASQAHQQSHQSGLTTSQGNFYTAGSSVDIDHEVNGDLIAAGGRISVERVVARDAASAGGTVEVRAPIADDVRVAGGNVTIDSRIGGELFAAAGTLRLAERSRVRAAAMLAGGDVKVQGRIDGDLGVAGREIFVDGSVGGSATLRGEHIVLGPLASIEGDLHYASPNPLQRDPGARITGTFTEQDTPAQWRRERDRSVSALVWIHPLFVLGLSLAGAVLFLIWPRALGTVYQTMRVHTLGAMLAGLALLFVTPPLIIVMMMSVIGIPLAFALLLLYPLFLLLAYLSAGFFIGKLILQGLKLDAAFGFTRQVLGIFIGLVVLALLTWVPFVNILVMLFALSAGLGSWAIWLYRDRRTGYQELTSAGHAV